ncbi:MAG: restriction endonuclease subunit S [Desulfurellaceae bacterium]|nr:restriction endonuclease subunit S [Desulfurellaceae bacterium]
MFAVYPGDIVFSKIDARNGAIGILPSEISKAVVTPEFPAFIPHPDRLDGEFVKLILRTGGFLAALRRQASGTSGRKRITPEAFLDLRIPLPSLTEQQSIVASYRVMLSRAKELEREAEEIETKATAAFETALGFDPPKPLPARPVFVVSFKDLDRWSHEGILRTTLHLEDKEPKFPIVELGTVGKVSYGLQKSPANRPGTHPRPYLRVANVQRSRLDLAEIKMINVPDEDMPKYRLEDGDVLLCEGNSAELVGRGAIWRNEIPHCVHQNHVLRARMDTSKVIPEFVLSVINLSYGQAYFRSKAKHTTNLASINSKEVSRFPLPLPPLSEQQRLIDKLFRGDKEAERLHQEATATRTRAWTDFETAVYATDEAVKAR